MMNEIEKSPYYMDSGKLPFASQISLRTRIKMYKLFLEKLNPKPTDLVLDVGVTCDEEHPESNYFEQFFPYKSNITCVGTEDGKYLEQKYPGIRYFCVEPKQPLPFYDKQFNIVFSNAVLEHTGDTESQKYFLSELCRVGEKIFITTPNRWFPIEMHTALPLIHFFPNPIYRYIYKLIGFDYWSKEENLNLVDYYSFQKLFPSKIHISFHKIITFMFVSNLIAYSV